MGEQPRKSSITGLGQPEPKSLPCLCAPTRTAQTGSAPLLRGLPGGQPVQEGSWRAVPRPAPRPTHTPTDSASVGTSLEPNKL